MVLKGDLGERNVSGEWVEKCWNQSVSEKFHVTWVRDGEEGAGCSVLRGPAPSGALVRI